MNIKKFGKIVYGASFTKDEQKAIDMEVRRQLKDYDEKHSIELDAIRLWEIREATGWGPKKLAEAYKRMYMATTELLNRYEMEEEDSLWLCTRKLKEIGVDIKAIRESIDK